MSRRRVLLFRVERMLDREGFSNSGTFRLFSSSRVAWPVVLQEGKATTSKTFMARISGADDLVIQRSASAWPLEGRASNSAGSIALLNGDRALDDLLAPLPFTHGANWRDGRYELRWCWDDEAADPSHTWEQCAIFQAGLIERVSTTANNRTLVFTFADPLAWLDVPLQTELYPDDFPNAAVRGKPKPITFGTVRYAPGVLRTTDELGPDAYSYDFHDAPIAAVSEAFDKGDVFTPGIDWSYTPDRHGIKLANKPDRPVCAHVSGDQRPVLQCIISGTFTSIGGTGRNRIARLSADAVLDTGFNPDADNAINAVAIQADGKVVIVGTFLFVGGTGRTRIARLNADGTLDTGFNAIANSTVNAVAIQSDGKIVIAGAFTTISGTGRSRIARLNVDGTLDTGFNPTAGGTVSVIAIQADGKIVLGGSFNAMGGVGRNRIARLNTNGTLDTGFNPDASGTVSAIAIQPDGRIVLGGSFTTIGGTGRNRIARLNTNGTLDTGFNPDANGTVSAIAIQADGKIVLGGSFSTMGGVGRSRIARLNASGTLDTAVSLAANSTVSALAVQPDGKVVLGGSFTTVDGIGRNRIARLNADGTLDTGFNPDANNNVSTIVLAEVNEPTQRLPAFVSQVIARTGAPYGYDNASLAALDAAAPYTLGVYLDGPITARTLLQRALDGWCGWIAPRRNGQLFVDRLQARGMDTGAITLTTASITGIQRRDVTAPGLTMRIAGRHRYTAHSDSDIATSVPDALRADLQADYTIKTASGGPPACYAHAQAAKAQETLLQDPAHLQAEIDRVASLFASQATGYELDAQLGPEVAESIEIGDWVHVIHDSYGLDAGLWLQVMGVTIRFRSRRVTLALLYLPEF